MRVRYGHARQRQVEHHAVFPGQVVRAELAGPHRLLPQVRRVPGDSLDRIGSTVAAVTSYGYPPKGVAWHYDESEFTPEKDKTWSSYRGYGDVTLL